MCNVAPTLCSTNSTSGASSFAISGVTELPTTTHNTEVYNTKTIPNGNKSDISNAINKTESHDLKKDVNISRDVTSVKHRSLPFYADPLIVGLREYTTLKKRLLDITERNKFSA